MPKQELTREEVATDFGSGDDKDKMDLLLYAAEEFKNLIDAFPTGSLIHPKCGIDIRQMPTYKHATLMTDAAWVLNFRRHLTPNDVQMLIDENNSQTE